MKISQKKKKPLDTNIKKKAELVICMKLVNAYVNYVHIMFRISNVTNFMLPVC